VQNSFIPAKNGKGVGLRLRTNDWGIQRGQNA
jgi:hypothetical protein